MKNKSTDDESEVGNIGELLLKIILIFVMVILSFALIYGSIKWIHLSLTGTNDQICKDSNSTLINGLCHSECNQPVNDKRNMLLIGGIAMPIFALLFSFYIILVIKTQFKHKKIKRLIK